MSGRRSKWFPPTRFQLTPLMDLLLIIVFAQFLEVRQTAQTQEADLAIQRRELLQQREFDQRQLDEAMRDRDDALASSRMRVRAAESALASLAATLGRGVEATNSMGLGGDASAKDSIRSVEKLASELADASPEAMARFLVSHAELLKRAEVWNLHAAAGGLIRLSAGTNAASFRLQRKGQDARTREAAEALFTAFKQLPQTKGLVIVLTSFDLQSRAGVYQPLIDALPAAMTSMAADSPQSQFEYTVLGATPDPASASGELEDAATDNVAIENAAADNAAADTATKDIETAPAPETSE